MTHSVRKSQYDAVCRERDELAAQVERLREAGEWLSEMCNMPSAVEHWDKALNETPAQSLREIRAEAGREGFKAGVDCYEKEGFKFLTPLGLSEMKEYEAEQYAQQIRSGDNE